MDVSDGSNDGEELWQRSIDFVVFLEKEKKEEEEKPRKRLLQGQLAAKKMPKICVIMNKLRKGMEERTAPQTTILTYTTMTTCTTSQYMLHYQ